MRMSAFASRAFCAIAATVLLLGVNVSPVHAQSRTLVVGVTDNVNSYNPIADSAAFMASVWCQVRMPDHLRLRGGGYQACQDRWESRTPPGTHCAATSRATTAIR
jgi:hypothetical protein